ncbi:MAG: addiction module protein [Bacteroidia bacterium]|nr:addiction module protein [Bacteroidia bacterium]
MKRVTVADALALSIPERIQLVEDIWDTIALKADAMELSDEEKRIIDERLKAYHGDPGAGDLWDKVYKRVITGHGV